MRLVIAGVLTLVIYLMTCAYGREKEEAPEVQEVDVPCYHFMPVREGKTIECFPSYDFYPLYFLQEDKGYAPAQTFPVV